MEIDEPVRKMDMPPPSFRPIREDGEEAAFERPARSEESDSDSLVRIKKVAPRRPPPVPMPVARVPTASVYQSSSSSVQDSYALLNQQMQASMRKETEASGVAVAGQLGRRVAERASYLVRQVERFTPGDSQLPRIVPKILDPLNDTFLRTIRCAAADASCLLLNPETDATLRSAMVVSPRAHEEAMLREPRSGEPACAAGNQCKGLHIHCAGGGAVLVAYYTVAEWAKYQDDLKAGVTTARLPDISRRCLLCIRYDVNREIVSLRAQNLGYRPSRDTAILTSFYNLVDVDGEYRMEDCIVSTGEVFEGLVMPIVKPSLLSFERTIDRETGTTFFRQLLPYPGAAVPKGPAATGF